MTTQTDFNIHNYNDDVLLRKISKCRKNDFQFGRYLKEYQSRISHNRLMFLKYRGTLLAHLCNTSANILQNKLDLVLQERKKNDFSQ